MTETMAFEAVLETASDWVEAVTTELETTQMRSGFAALRAVLHALRDSLDLERTVQFGDQLPILIRGLYYEGWVAGNGTPHIRRPEEFLETVRRALRRHAELPDDPVTTVAAILAALGKCLPRSELDAVMVDLPLEIRWLCRPRETST
jgi:uncharacterized protein (DUF2267 family)